MSRSRSPELRNWREEDDYNYDYGHRHDSRHSGSSTRYVETRHHSDKARVSRGYKELDALSGFREEILRSDKNGSRHSTDSGHNNDPRHGGEERRYTVMQPWSCKQKKLLLTLGKERGDRSHTRDSHKHSRSPSQSRERQVVRFIIASHGFKR